MSKSLVLVCVLAACGPGQTRGNGNGGGGADGNTGGGSGDGSACATENVKAQMVPLDLFVMLDQSGSMSDNVAGGGTKWSAVTGALNTFVQQPNLDGISIGLGYFGVPAGGATCSAIACNTNADCGASACGPCVANICIGALGGGQDSCTASDYSHAAVEIAPLPGVGSQITSSMAGHSPTTGTPTSAALQGALDHAKSWSQMHPGDAVAVIFATDGDPSECDTDLSHINQIASLSAGMTPKILTFVIGVGSSLTALNGIAAAGGTNMAYLVDTGGNVNQQFLAAMNAIRGAALGCVYQIPVPQMGNIDFSTVNLVYTPGGGAAQVIPQVPDTAHCPATRNAWYYDNPAMPTLIELCDATCSTVQADPAGQMNISLGCSTVIF